VAERTGLPALEAALLATAADTGAGSDAPRRQCAQLLADFDRRHGCGRRYGYPLLIDLATPWTVWLPLLDGAGNFGSPDPDDEPAAPEYTRCRLSAAGMLAVAADRGEGPPVPVGLINGSMYRGGQQPPYDPHRMIAAVLRAAQSPGLPDDELTAAAGPPAFPAGCEVDGDLAGLVVGRRARLRLTAAVTVGHWHEQAVLDITRLPPGTGRAEVIAAIRARARRPPPWALDRHPELLARGWVPVREVREERDEASSGSEPVIRCVLLPGTDPDRAAAAARETWGVSITAEAVLPAPLPALLKSWTRRHGPGAATAGARLLARTF
jgi:DNA gyrase/topoisomerase IV subunit A